MLVRHTTLSDLDRIMKIYDGAKAFMARCGNPSQWRPAYPSRDLLVVDIKAHNSYVIEKDGLVVGVFSFIIGPDPTYGVIDGKWIDNTPYGTVHRIASAGGVSGIADVCFDFCFSLISHVRIDTHADNAPMLRCIRRHGFHYCGIITIADGSPRLAFEKSV